MVVHALGIWSLSSLICTNWQIFVVRLECLEKEDTEVMVSVIENFICDEVKEIDQSDVNILGETINNWGVVGGCFCSTGEHPCVGLGGVSMVWMVSNKKQ